MMALIYIRKQITLALLRAVRITATTSAARYYAKCAIEYEDGL